MYIELITSMLGQSRSSAPMACLLRSLVFTAQWSESEVRPRRPASVDSGSGFALYDFMTCAFFHSNMRAMEWNSKYTEVVWLLHSNAPFLPGGWSYNAFWYAPAGEAEREERCSWLLEAQWHPSSSLALKLTKASSSIIPWIGHDWAIDGSVYQLRAWTFLIDRFGSCQNLVSTCNVHEIY